MKKQLRQKILAHRKKLSPETIREKSLAIKKSLFALHEFVQAKTIMLYYSVNNEVFTHDLIEECLGVKKVLLPKLMLDEIHPVEITSLKALVSGVYSIMEPKSSDRFEGAIDLIVVPGVVFDAQKNRIGMGKGYYDRFLATPQSSKAYKVGLAYDFQLVKLLPIDHSDVPVDIILTEKKIIR